MEIKIRSNFAVEKGWLGGGGGVALLCNLNGPRSWLWSLHAASPEPVFLRGQRRRRGACGGRRRGELEFGMHQPPSPHLPIASLSLSLRAPLLFIPRSHEGKTNIHIIRGCPPSRQPLSLLLRGLKKVKPPSLPPTNDYISISLRQCI